MTNPKGTGRVIPHSTYTVVADEKPQVGSIVTDMDGQRIRVTGEAVKSIPGWQVEGQPVDESGA